MSDRGEVIEQAHGLDAEVSPGFGGRDIPVIVRDFDGVVDDGTGRGKADGIGRSGFRRRKIMADGIIGRREVGALKFEDVVKAGSVRRRQCKTRIGPANVTY